ncbi:hypothetical protein GCM10023200_54070 [Actinomycetospora chlora]|uniref:Uncharacterized protein n=1 Tax=Actinomycetospora chlora TaxID=663608 RepID=A0ABP9CEJ8_9PSEU
MARGQRGQRGQRAGTPFDGAGRTAEAGPEVVGVRDGDAAAAYVPRPVDDALEDALGAERPLVVVAGQRLAGTSRAVHRALRRMLGDGLLLPVADPHTADLAAAVGQARTLAARSGPAVVLVDDAPPALLDQITGDLVAGLDPTVRLVVTTRRGFLDAFLEPATHAVLDAALVEVPPADDGRPFGEHVRPIARARAVLDPVGWSSLVPLALLRTAVDWDRLGVPLPLTPALLAEVAPVHLAALGVPAPGRGGLRRAARELVRTDHGGMRLLHEVATDGGRARLAADRVFARLADGPGGWPVPEELARDLWHRLDAADRARVARVALARGEDQVALWLATQVPPDDLAPEALYRLGVTLAERSAAHAPQPGRWDRGAVNWLVAALDRTDDPDLVARAQQRIVALERRLGADEPGDPVPDEAPTVDVPAAREPSEPRSGAPRREGLIYLRPREASRA